MKPRPVVSVIIAAFNAEEYILKAISSVLKQTMTNLEVIVVDDSSTDDTMSKITGIQDERVRLYPQPVNRGPSFCRNYAIECAQGDWIAILDSDDWWDPARLDVLLQKGTESQADIVCDDLYLVKNETATPQSTYLKSRETVIGRVTGDMTINSMMMIHDDYGVLQPLMRADFIIEKGIRYKDNHRYGEDFVFLLDCLLADAKMILHPIPYYYYRMGHVSASASAENPIGQCNLLQEMISSPPYNQMSQVREALQEKLNKKRLIVEELRTRQLFQQRRFVKGIATVLQHPTLLVGYVRSVKTKLLSSQ